jgi:hypothetical protein
VKSGLGFLDDHQRWKRIHDDLWTFHTDLRLMGAQAGRRMVAVRRAGSAWALFSPVPLDDASRAELDSEGRVDALVVPTAFHNTFVPESAIAFPDAAVYLVKGARRQEMPPERCHTLTGGLPAEWGEDLVSFPLEGIPRSNEVEFVHLASRTLLISDLCFHIDERYPPWTRLLFRLAGARPGIRPSRLFRTLIRDREAFLRSLDRILACDFDRVVMSHGTIIEEGGKKAIRALRQRFAE